MGTRLWCLSWISIVLASQSTFNVHDDLFAYPQYDIDFSDHYILQAEVSARLSAPPILHDSSKASSSVPSSSSTLAADLSSPSLSNFQDPFRDTSADKSQPPPTYERLILSSRPHLCTIPTVPPTDDATKNTTSSPAEEAAELGRAATRGWELLKDMEGNCMYFFSGWWSYSFCYNSNVKQFHQLPPGKGAPMYPPVEDPATPSYVLGNFPPPPKQDPIAQARLDAPATGGDDTSSQESEDSLPPDQNPSKAAKSNIPTLKSRGPVRYLSQTLSGGTTCDLTGRDRRVEVQFHCHPQSGDRIGWIKEVSTCSYLMVIYTPRLCNEVAFLPSKGEKSHQISCVEILKDESEADDWKRRKHEELERRNSQQKTLGENGRPMVGTIEVGAQRLVGGSPDRTITPPAMGGQPSNPQAKIYVITSKARNTPNGPGKLKKMDAQTLEKLGLDKKVVDQAAVAMEKAAEGKGWKLEGWEGDGGVWELRGFIEGEEGQGEEKVEWDIGVKGGSEETPSKEDETVAGDSQRQDEQTTADDEGEEEEEVGSQEEMMRDEL